LVADRGKVLFQVQPALVPLLKQSGLDRGIQMIGRDEPLPPFDVQIPLLSVPGLLGTKLDNVPSADRPYLVADPALVDRWRATLGPPRGLRVGIAWQGRATHRGDRYRSIPLTEFAPLAQPGIELISLQKGTGAEQRGALAGSFELRELGSDFDQSHG